MLTLVPKFAPWPKERPVYDGVVMDSALIEDHILGGGWVRSETWDTADAGARLNWYNIALKSGSTIGFSDEPMLYPVLDPSTPLSAYEETLIKFPGATWSAKYGKWFAFDFFPAGFLLNAAGWPVNCERQGANLKAYSYDMGWNRVKAVEDPTAIVGIFDAGSNGGMCGGANSAAGAICLYSGIPGNGYHFDMVSRKQIFVRKKPQYILPTTQAGDALTVTMTGNQLSNVSRATGSYARRSFLLQGERNKQRISVSFSAYANASSQVRVGLVDSEYAAGLGDKVQFTGPHAVIVPVQSQTGLLTLDQIKGTSGPQAWNVNPYVTGALNSYDIVYDFEANVTELYVDSKLVAVSPLTADQSEMRYLGIMLLGTAAVLNLRIVSKDRPTPSFNEVYSQFRFAGDSLLDEVSEHAMVLNGTANVADGAVTVGNTANGFEFEQVLFNANENFGIELEYEQSSVGTNAGCILANWTTTGNSGTHWFIRTTGNNLEFWWNGVQLMGAVVTRKAKNHVAVVRDKGQFFTMYYNGIPVATAVNNAGNTGSASSTRVRTTVTNTDSWTGGKRDNIRITKGRAPYKATFTPDVLPAIAYPEYTSREAAQIIAQACFRNNTAIEEKTKTPLTLSAGFPLVNGRAIVGHYADQLAFPAGQVVNGSGDFTIEFRAKFLSMRTGQILGQWKDAGNQRGWSMWLNAAGTAEFDITTNGSTLVRVYTYSGIVVNVDYDFKIERISGIMYFYLNGVCMGRVANTSNIFASNRPIGTSSDDGTNWVNQEISNIRISAVAQYGGGALKPVASFPKFK